MNKHKCDIDFEKHEQVPVILSPSTEVSFCVYSPGAVLCFHKVTLVVIFGCLVSRICQPIAYSYCTALALSTAMVLFASLVASL